MSVSARGVDRPRTTPSSGLDQVAWVPGRDIDRRQWLKVGSTLGRLGRYSRWWVGDWLLYANRRWGEMYVEAAQITGYDYGTLRNLASVARKFTLSRRRDNLSWGHHADLASLAPAEQDYWLDRAAELRLSREDLRIELRTARRLKASRSRGVELGSGGSDVNTMVCPKCGDEIPIPQ